MHRKKRHPSPHSGACQRCRNLTDGYCSVGEDMTSKLQCWGLNEKLPLDKCVKCGIVTDDYDESYLGPICRECFIPDYVPRCEITNPSALARHAEEHGEIWTIPWPKRNRARKKKEKNKLLSMKQSTKRSEQ